ncbi:MAG: hypothetical protein JOY59_12775 [Candidatus Eremiobacteraeota bacterium]|nr:hypothetical protein [Candidatus Eremiobacteraeota bacterium]
MQTVESLPSRARDPEFRAQLQRVRRIGLEALRTPGARLIGVAMLLFAPVFARWFVAGVKAQKASDTKDPFVYRMV